MNIHQQHQQRINHLRSEVNRLRAAVSHFAGPEDQRLTLIHKLEVTLDLQAEVEELGRIDS
jgi:hypothetical protein